MAEAPTITLRLDPNGIDQIAAIIAHLKQRNDELTAALTAVQEVCNRQLEELRQLRQAAATQPLENDHPSRCICVKCSERSLDNILKAYACSVSGRVRSQEPILGIVARELVFCLRGIVNNPQLRLEELCEWSLAEETLRRDAKPDETVVFVPQMGLWASVLSSAVKSNHVPTNQPPRGGYAGEEQE